MTKTREVYTEIAGEERGQSADQRRCERSDPPQGTNVEDRAVLNVSDLRGQSRAIVLRAVIPPGVLREFPWMPPVSPVGVIVGPAGELLLVREDGSASWLNAGGSRGTRSASRGGAA